MVGLDPVALGNSTAAVQAIDSVGSGRHEEAPTQRELDERLSVPAVLKVPAAMSER
jgi:hypothetical protein